MVVMPLITFLMIIVFLIAGIPLYFILIWLLVMLAGSLFRVPISVAGNLLMMGDRELSLIRKDIKWLLHATDKLTGRRKI